MKAKPMNFKKFLMFKSIGIISDKSEEMLKQAKRPLTLCGVKTPENFDELTIGQLTELMDMNDGNNIIASIVVVMPKVNINDVVREDAVKVVGFFNFMQGECERIGAMFSQIEYEPTAQQIQAGYEDLNFGIFGTIDWYARRMGYHDHDEVLKVPWLRVWQCALNDSKTRKFEQNLNNIISKS